MRCDDCNSNVTGERVLRVGCADAHADSLRAARLRQEETNG